LCTLLFRCSGLYPQRFGGRFSDYVSGHAQDEVPAMTVPAMQETPERENNTVIAAAKYSNRPI
jgi:hypothetical protein